jgi:hypothetical protein
VFSEAQRLVSFRSGLGAFFEGAVHLFEPPMCVGVEATREQGYEQALERFSLDETNTVPLKWLDSQGVLTIEKARHQQVT